MRIGFIAVIVAVCALTLTAVLMQQRVTSADGHSCPSSWPSESYEGRHTDDQGEGWFLIRSTDSNGFTTIRAYMADDNHSSGYAPGSPDEICILLVRRSGDSEDADQPERLVFSQEREEPSQTPATGGPSTGGGSQDNNADVIAILAAALKVARHASALDAAGSVATHGGMTRESLGQSAREVAAHQAVLDAQLMILNGSGQTARVDSIEAFVNRLTLNVGRIQNGRRPLLEALAVETRSRQKLTEDNSQHLFPNANTYLDDEFYDLATGVSGSGNLSSDDIVRYSHAQSLSSNSALGHTFLLVASLLQDPTFVARIRESYDSVAGGIERDVAYLSLIGDTQLDDDILPFAEAALNAGSGENNYFDRLERRLELTVAENALIAENEEVLGQLLVELDHLAAVVQGRSAPPPGTLREEDPSVPGVTASEVKFGQSAAFSGQSQELGLGMRLGIEAAFHEANQNNGVNGRMLKLTALDDGYEPDSAFANTRRLIENERVFALIGAVGTPTSRAASPLAHAAGVPFIAPFTGAQLLRDPELTNVLNLRASYHQETEEMVAYLTEERGLTKVAVLYQNDSYGIDGLAGVSQALQQRNLEPVASWLYRRNTEAVKSAVFRIAAAEPEAVIIIGTHLPTARAIEMLRDRLGPDTVYMSVSFVGSNALADELGNNRENVFVTQVVPLPDDESIGVVEEYQAALTAYAPNADYASPVQREPGFVSLEGYLAGRLAIEGLKACGTEVTRQCFLDAVQNAGTIDLSGFPLTFGPTDNQGSDEVILTMIGSDGQYVSVE